MRKPFSQRTRKGKWKVWIQSVSKIPRATPGTSTSYYYYCYFSRFEVEGVGSPVQGRDIFDFNDSRFINPIPETR